MNQESERERELLPGLADIGKRRIAILKRGGEASKPEQHDRIQVRYEVKLAVKGG